MSMHNVGDMVATYADAGRNNYIVGWISELIYETIWIGDNDSRKLRYKVEWSDGKEDVVPWYTDEDIEHMRNLYAKFSEVKT